MKKFASLFGIALCCGVSSNVLTLADPIYPNPGNIAPTETFTATRTGQEIGYFYGASADDTDLIAVFDNGVQLGTWSLNNQTSTFGEAVNFGKVHAGDTIVLGLLNETTGFIFSSDPSKNPAEVNAVYATNFNRQSENGVTIPRGTFVGFDDMPIWQDDLTYNDEDVVFSNLTAVDPATDPAATPEPASLALLGLGLAGTGLGVVRRKKI